MRNLKVTTFYIGIHVLCKKVDLDQKISENVKGKGFTSLLQKINERYRDQVNEKSKGDHVLRRYVNYVLC